VYIINVCYQRRYVHVSTIQMPVVFDISDLSWKTFKYKTI